MDIFRRSLIVMIAVLLLPWGAHGATVTSSDATAVSHHIVTDDATALTTPAKKCRTATLTGAPCGPEIVACSLPPNFNTRHTNTEPFPTAVWRAANRPQAPPTDPPRLS